MSNCKYCGKPLHISQYAQSGTLKSCPRCSVIDGEEHIFFSYPEYFGNTPKRSTTNHLEGPQSYCVPHRSNPNKPITPGGKRCSEIGEK